MEKSHFKQAELWLVGARYISAKENEDSEKYSIAIAMLVHAILKANDALTTKFLNKTAKKHDNAKDLFDEMIRKNNINAEYAHYKSTIQEAINNKAKAEYKIAFFSKRIYEDLERKAEKFLGMVEKIVNKEGKN